MKIVPDEEQPKFIFILAISGTSAFKSNYVKPIGTEAKVLSFLLEINKPNDTRQVISIKSIDVNGHIQDYEVIFDGKLKLEVVPQQEKSQGESYE